MVAGFSNVCSVDDHVGAIPLAVFPPCQLINNYKSLVVIAVFSTSSFNQSINNVSIKKYQAVKLPYVLVMDNA